MSKVDILQIVPKQTEESIGIYNGLIVPINIESKKVWLEVNGTKILGFGALVTIKSKTGDSLSSNEILKGALSKPITTRDGNNAINGFLLDFGPLK